jgi:TonB family protein
MKMDTLHFAAIVLAAALPVLAADTSPDSALQVTSTDLQVVSTPARRAEAYIVVRNVSSRTITHFSYSVLARYADGSEQTTRGKVDLLNSLMLDELRPLSGSAQSPGSLERLGLGDSRKITALFPLSAEGLAPVSVTTRIVMVVLDDNTALGDPTEIRNLQYGRMQDVQWFSALVADLRSVKNSPSPKKAVDELILSLSGGASSGDSITPGRVAMLRMVLKALDRPAGVQSLDKALVVYEAQLAFVTKHSNLGAPPPTEDGARSATRTATTPVVESVEVSTLPEPLQSMVRAKMAPFLGRQISGGLIREMMNAAHQVDSRLDLLGNGGKFSLEIEELSTTNFPSTPGVQRIKVSRGVQEAKLSNRPKFVYPPQARDARISGTVRFDVLIGTDGHVKGIQLVSGHPLLVPAVQEMVTQSVYRPTLQNGQPVEVQTQVEINFTLQ